MVASVLPCRTKGRSDSVFQFFSSQTGIAAVNPGAQATATPLTADQCFIATVPAGGSGVKLPRAQAGRCVSVVNQTATSANVYPYLGDNINALAANAPLAVTNAAPAIFLCGIDGTWWSK